MSDTTQNVQTLDELWAISTEDLFSCPLPTKPAPAPARRPFGGETDQELVEARATELTSAIYQLGALDDQVRASSHDLQGEIERRGLQDRVEQLVDAWRNPPERLTDAQWDEMLAAARGLDQVLAAEDAKDAELAAVRGKKGEPAPAPARRLCLPTEPFAPRPGYNAGLHEYRLGILAGTRRFRCLGSLAWYRQARPRQMPAPQRRRQFAALDILPFNDAALVVPLAGPAIGPDCAWCGGPAERSIPNACTALCPACLDAWLHGSASVRKNKYRQPGRGRRASYTQTLFSFFGVHRRIRSQRINRRTYLWKRHSRFVLRAGTLHYLASRRYAAAVCRRQGLTRIKPGVWFDPAGGRCYLQADSVEPCDYITMGAA